MQESKHIRHYHRHFGFSYPVSIQQRIYSLVLLPLFILLASFVILFFIAAFSLPSLATIPFSYLIDALLATLARLTIAFILALVLAIPVALAINHNSATERFLLPLFDIIQSIPALAFFPIIILFFIRFNFLNGAAIFILFLSMLWNIVFNLIGGLKVIPGDIKAAAQVLQIKGFAYIQKVLLPSVFPYLVTGSLLAWAQAWNVTIVAEVLHTYIPGGDPNQDLFGLGSILVSSVSSGQHAIFFAALFMMIVAIALLNFFVWQKLLRYAEKYKFE